MKKLISTVIFIVIVSLGIGLYYVYTNLDYLIKEAIEKHGSQATHTSVRVKKVKTNLADAAVTISGLTVANPGNFDFPYVFSMDKISTRVNINSLKEEPYIIEEIVIRAPQVFFEVNNDKKINIDKLKENIVPASSASSNGSAARQAKQEISEGEGPQLIIRRVLFTGGNILAKITPLKNKEYELKLPTLDMRNLGGKRGATANKITKEIVERLIAQAKKALKEKGIDRELSKLKKELRDKVDYEKAKLKAKVDAKKQKAKAKLDAEKAKLEARKNEAKQKLEADKTELKAKKDAKLEAEKQKAKEKLKSLFN